MHRQGISGLSLLHGDGSPLLCSSAAAWPGPSQDGALAIGVPGTSGSAHSTWELGKGLSPEPALGNSPSPPNLGTFSQSEKWTPSTVNTSRFFCFPHLSSLQGAHPWQSTGVSPPRSTGDPAPSCQGGLCSGQVLSQHGYLPDTTIPACPKTQPAWLPARLPDGHSLPSIFTVTRAHFTRCV